MEDNTWLQELKPGDKVYDSKSGIFTIKRLTPTEIIMEVRGELQKVAGVEGSRFNRQTGRSIGTGDWDTYYIQPLTNEIIKEINKKYYIRKLNAFDFITLNNDELLKEIFDKVFPKKDK
jgi:hypothetical protein